MSDLSTGKAMAVFFVCVNVLKVPKPERINWSLPDCSEELVPVHFASLCTSWCHIPIFSSLSWIKNGTTAHSTLFQWSTLTLLNIDCRERQKVWASCLVSFAGSIWGICRTPNVLSCPQFRTVPHLPIYPAQKRIGYVVPATAQLQQYLAQDLMRFGIRSP